LEKEKIGPIDAISDKKKSPNGEEEGDARAGTVETKTGAETCPDGDDETFGTGSTSFR